MQQIADFLSANSGASNGTLITFMLTSILSLAIAAWVLKTNRFITGLAQDLTCELVDAISREGFALRKIQEDASKNGVDPKGVIEEIIDEFSKMNVLPGRNAIKIAKMVSEHNAGAVKNAVPGAVKRTVR